LPGTQQTHRVLAMQATYRNEFIQDTPSFLPVAPGITYHQCTNQFISCCHTDLPHLRSPSVLLGSKLREATGQPPGAFQARQCGHHPDCRATRLLKAVRERDQERQERIRLTRVAQALKLQNEKLRSQVREITTDAAVRTNSRSSEPDS
jgi:hypothetical protein